jgi:exodeoxyribonuclease V alpha subunit
MTVHKAQGSEFDRVVVVLPQADARVLSRELLYTAVTRARHRVDVVGDAGALVSAAERVTRRRSGLASALGVSDTTDAAGAR